MNRHINALVLLLVVLVIPATAQVGLNNGRRAGVGTITLGPINTNILNGGNAELGIQYYPGDGRFYVTRRGTGIGTVAPHNILVVDQTGALVSTVQQGPGLTGGIWGHRDGATDGYAGGTKLFFGDDFGVHCYEMTSGSPVYVTGPQMVATASGPQPCTFPLAVQTLTGGVTRALEYNPAGNGGLGSFWACNFAGPLVQFSLTGTVLSTFPGTVNPIPQWSAYGLALNLQTGMLWVNSSPAGSATVVADVAEINPATGVFTGRRIRPAGTAGVGTWIYAAQGGLCYVQGRTGPTFGPAVTPPYSELCVMTQGTPDYFALHRLDLQNGFDSALETQLEVSMNAGPYTSANSTWTPGTVFEWRYNTPAANPGSPALLVANVGPPATPIPFGNTINIAEYVSLNALSVPTASASSVVAFTLGDGFLLGGLLAPDFLIMAATTQPATPSIPPIILPNLGGPGTQVTLQAVYLSPTFNAVATNFLVLTQS